jgi:TolB-like protein/Flp pilus assembly protein TadD
LEVEARLKRTSRPGISRGEAAEGNEQSAVGGILQESAARTVDVQTARTTSSVEYVVSKIRRHRLGVALAAAALIIAITAVIFIARNGSIATNREPTTAATSNEATESVAVLPFVNASNDPNTEYLSDGISDSIINSLSRLPSMKVISLNAVLPYKGKQIDPQTVGHQLNVRAVLMGRMIQRGDDLVISAELVNVRDNHRLWGAQYSRKLSDILVVQDDISRQIAEGLRLRLTGEEKRQLAKHYTENAEAYQFYSLGKYQFRKNTKEGLDKSIEYFEQALKIDPNYALAYVGLGGAYGTLGQQGYWLPKEARQKMEWAALKAVEIDDTLAEGHTFLGYVKRTNFDWAGAEKEHKRALELDPNSYEANFVYLNYLVDVGRADEALPFAKRAEEIAGADSLPLVAFVYLSMRQYDTAIELYLKARERNSSPAANFQLAEAYLRKGMSAEAIAEMQKYVKLRGDPERWESYPILAYAYAAGSRRDEALKILSEQERLSKERYISPFNFAIIYTGLGDKDRAFEYLNKAYDERVTVFCRFPNRTLFDPLHSDPRYKDLLRRMNLEPRAD